MRAPARVILTLIILVLLTILVPVGLRQAIKNLPKTKNIINNDRIIWSKTWTRLMTVNTRDYEFNAGISGSDFMLAVIGTRKITVNLKNRDPKERGGIEFWLNGKYVNYPLFGIKDKTVEFNTDSGLQNNLKARIYCYTANGMPCNISVTGISADFFSWIKSIKTKRPIIAFLGDSISSNLLNKNYTYISADKINYSLINSSYNRSVLTPSQKFNSGILRLQNEIVRFTPNILVIFIGSNDLAAGVDPLIFRENLEKAIAAVKKMSPRTKIAILGIIPRINIDSFKINEYNSVIKEVAGKEQVLFVDNYSWLTDEEIPDGVHPAESVQTKMADFLINELKKGKLLD